MRRTASAGALALGLAVAAACGRGLDEPRDERGQGARGPGAPAAVADGGPAGPTSGAGPPAAAASGAPPLAASAGPPAPSGAAHDEPADVVTLAGPGGVPAARARRVLHVGDSMTPLVGNYLRPLFARGGATYDLDTRTSATTQDFAREGWLRAATYRYDPELILISLGSNELFDPRPEARADDIRQIISETRGRPCLWIGPPAWKPDRGFLRVLRQHVGPCRYFASSELTLERMEDGRHPSWTGSWHWASAVWRALGGVGEVPRR